MLCYGRPITNVKTNNNIFFNCIYNIKYILNFYQPRIYFTKKFNKSRVISLHKIQRCEKKSNTVRIQSVDNLYINVFAYLPDSEKTVIKRDKEITLLRYYPDSNEFF